MAIFGKKKLISFEVFYVYFNFAVFILNPDKLRNESGYSSWLTKSASISFVHLFSAHVKLLTWSFVGCVFWRPVFRYLDCFECIDYLKILT